MTQTKMLHFAIQTAKGAGAILMKHFGNISSYKYKSTPIDLLTIADTKSEAFIVNEIKTTFPDHHIHRLNNDEKDQPGDQNNSTARSSHHNHRLHPCSWSHLLQAIH